MVWDQDLQPPLPVYTTVPLIVISTDFHGQGSDADDLTPKGNDQR